MIFRHDFRFLGIIVSMLLPLLLAAGGQAATPDGARPFHWIDDDDYYPFIYRDNQGKAAGVYRDIMEEIFRRLDVPLSIDIYPWRRAQKYVIEGKGDGMITVMTRKRSRNFLATDPIYIINEHAFARRDNPRFEQIQAVRSVQDLKGFRIVETIGSGWSEENFRDLDVTWVPTFESGIRMLAKGRVDIFVLGKYPGMVKIQQRIERSVPYADDLKMIVPGPAPLARLPYSLLIKKDSPYVDSIPRINRILGQMKRDGSYQAILDRYLNSDERVSLETTGDMKPTLPAQTPHAGAGAMERRIER